MESVIHQSLGHIFHFHAGVFPIAQIENAFVGNETPFAFEQDRKITIESFCDVIRVQDRDFRGAFQSLGTHHANVHPRDGENAGAAVGSSSDGTNGRIADF